MPRRLRIAPLMFVAALGCGAHLHRPQDASSSESAAGELKAARLTEGFAEEVAQSKAMLTEELAAAQAAAEVGRDRDLLDILSATGESDPETEILYFPRCRARFKGDGWTTLCSKISSRLFALTGHVFPLPVAAPARREADASGSLDAAEYLRRLRDLQRRWKGPNSDESQLARAADEYTVAARALRLSPAVSPPARCPLLDLPGRAPDLQGHVDRLRGQCRARRDNLRALADRAICRGPGCGPSELGEQVERSIAVHDALAAHHDELVRRIYAYQAAKHPCSTRGANKTKEPGPSDQPPAATPTAASPAAPRAVCDEAVLQARFVALGDISVPPALARDDLAPLARLGRLYQLDEQIGAVDALIDELQLQARRRVEPEVDPALVAGAPRFARVLEATIEGIDRIQAALKELDLAVLALIRETLRVERGALAEAQAFAERRVRLERVKLGAQLDEAVLLTEALTGLHKLELAGCPRQGLVAAHEAKACRDDLTRALVAFGNAWTLGRAAQRQADVLDLGARHDASLARSRAAMAVREVYLAAGVAELVKFNKGGLAPEALAQLIVQTVGFAVLAGGVYTR